MYNNYTGFSLKSMFRCATEFTSNEFDDFLATLPENSSMPYPVNKIANEPNRSNIPENENLPQAVQDVIGEIKAAESIGEKAAMAHSFSNAYIHNLNQDSGDGIISFEELANNPHGDCDDYSDFTMGLLIRGGVDPKDMYQLAAKVNYESVDESLNYRNSGGHALTIISDGEEFYLLDNNAAGIVTIDPENPIVNVTLAHDNGSQQEVNGQPVEVTLEIEYVGGATDGQNIGYSSSDNMDKLTELTRENGAEAEVAVEDSHPDQQNTPIEAKI